MLKDKRNESSISSGEPLISHPTYVGKSNVNVKSSFLYTWFVR